eukprot:CAMPEP_0114508346 /NCGR_PEP_ID=MMETSP0109-20121206/12549_1 /TAXON_ID=29199 /ORGANISM="Chlorarachnion reptans, Strain CCCM449" /LENGTH=63 /DNA_ID=CAMNT_0001687269 /DNA_START=464 /DNA_END=656 /DNA_ORIENTATION=+
MAAARSASAKREPPSEIARLGDDDKVFSSAYALPETDLTGTKVVGNLAFDSMIVDFTDNGSTE